MINMIPHIMEHKHAGSYKLVVATSYLDVLSEKFQNLKLVVDYDPFEPADEDIRNHGIVLIFSEQQRSYSFKFCQRITRIKCYPYGNIPATLYNTERFNSNQRPPIRRTEKWIISFLRSLIEWDRIFPLAKANPNSFTIDDVVITLIFTLTRNTESRSTIRPVHKFVNTP